MQNTLHKIYVLNTRPIASRGSKEDAHAYRTRLINREVNNVSDRYTHYVLGWGNSGSYITHLLHSSAWGSHH